MKEFLNPHDVVERKRKIKVWHLFNHANLSCMLHVKGGIIYEKKVLGLIFRLFEINEKICNLFSKIRKYSKNPHRPLR